MAGRARAAAGGRPALLARLACSLSHSSSPARRRHWRFFKRFLRDARPPYTAEEIERYVEAWSHEDVPNLDRVERLPDASHWVHHDEAERVNELLVDFLAPGSGSHTAA